MLERRYNRFRLGMATGRDEAAQWLSGRHGKASSDQGYLVGAGEDCSHAVLRRELGGAGACVAHVR